MAKNEFLPFGIAEGANVLSNQEYERLTARFNGFVSGVAKSKELNTVWRQSSVMSSALAQFIVDSDNKNLLDNGDITGIKNRLVAAIKQTISGVGYVTTAAMNLELNKKFDKANISGQKGNDNDKVPSLNLFTTEIGKLAALGYSYSKIESDGRYQPKGNYAPAGDYATNTALNNGLNQKLNISGGRATGAIFASSFTVYYSGIKNIMNLYSPQTEEDLAYFQYSNDKGWLGRLEIPRLESGKGQLISTIDLEQGTNTSSITVYKSGSSYPMLRLKRSDGAVVYIEAKPDEQASLAQLYRRNTAGQIEYNISFPKRTGTVAIEGDSYKKNESDALMLGINQKWTDVKSQRSKGTTYTNTTGKPIVVMLSALITGGGSGINSTMTIDDVDFVFKSGGQDGSSGNTWKGSAISIIIPTNSKYKFESMGNIESWLELRA